MTPTADIHKATRERPGAEARIAALKAEMIQRVDAEARQPKPVKARLRDTVRHLVPTRVRTH